MSLRNVFVFLTTLPCLKLLGCYGVKQIVHWDPNFNNWTNELRHQNELVDFENKFYLLNTPHDHECKEIILIQKNHTKFIHLSNVKSCYVNVSWIFWMSCMCFKCMLFYKPPHNFMAIYVSWVYLSRASIIDVFLHNFNVPNKKIAKEKAKKFKRSI